MKHDTTNRCINTSHIVKIKFRLQCDLIELQGGYLGTIHMETSIRHFKWKSFVQFGTFVSRVKLPVLEECSIRQMTECPAIVITQKTHVNSKFLLFCAGQKR